MRLNFIFLLVICFCVGVSQLANGINRVASKKEEWEKQGEVPGKRNVFDPDGSKKATREVVTLSIYEQK